MKLSDIREKDSRELLIDAQKMKKELFELRFRNSTEDISKTSRFRDLRRTIARINTIVHERNTKAANESAAKS